MNTPKYNSLPDDLKAIVDKHSGEAFAALAGRGWDTINNTGFEVAKAAGNSIVEASDELKSALDELNAKFIADYIAATEDFGLNGQEVIDYFAAEAAKAGSS